MARSSPPVPGPAIFAREPLSLKQHWTPRHPLPLPARGSLAECLLRPSGRAVDRKCTAQAPQVAWALGERDAPIATRPNLSQAPGSALVVVHALPQHTQTPGKGLGLATCGAGAWRGQAARTGGRGRWLRASRTAPGLEEGARRPPRGPGAREGWGGNSGCPLGLHSASELGASAGAQLDSQGPEGGRGQGCATGDRDTGTLIC